MHVSLHHMLLKMALDKCMTVRGFTTYVNILMCTALCMFGTYIQWDWEEAKAGKLILLVDREEELDKGLSFAACILIFLGLGHHGEFKEHKCEVADTYSILQTSVHSFWCTHPPNAVMTS